MEWVYDYLDIPFCELGRDRRCLDCWGLVSLLYRDRHGLALPDYKNRYSSCRDVEISKLIRRESENWITIPRGEERLGDVLVFKMLGVPMHTAYTISKNKMIHIYKGSDVSVEDYSRPNWTDRLITIKRHKELA